MRYLFLIVLVIMLSACGDSNRPPKPDNLISPETMSDVMYDVFLLNAAKGINRNVLETNGIQSQAYVFNKYKIDSLQFVKSNDYYAYDPDTYADIIERVKLRLEASKKLNDSLQIIEKKLEDSLDLSKRPVLQVDSLAMDTMLSIDTTKTKRKRLFKNN